MVSGVERRLDLCDGCRGRRRDDHDGKPFRARPFQGRLRPGRRLVPVVQGQGGECLWRRLHGQEQGNAERLPALRPGRRAGLLPAQPFDAERDERRPRPDLHGHRDGARQTARDLVAQGSETPRGGSLGRLPRHVYRPVRHLGRREHRAREEDVRTDADRALPAWFAFRLLRHLGVRPDRSGRADAPGHLPKGWNWGYRSMTTVQGLFTAGDGVGASGHKFSSGSFAEGRIAAKAMVKYALDNKDWKPELQRTRDELVEEIYRPVRNFIEHKDYTTAIDINPHYITPKMLQFRLQKIMDEYVAGVGTYYRTNNKMLEVAEGKLEMLKEDSLKMRAKDLHELLRAWENFHRIMAAEAHMKHIQFREETRYPGFYYRMDHNYIDDVNWKCFVNSTYDRTTRKWSLKKVPYVQLIK